MRKYKEGVEEWILANHQPQAKSSGVYEEYCNIFPYITRHTYLTHASDIMRRAQETETETLARWKHSKDIERKRRVERREMLNKVKLESGCIACGENRYAVLLDFHHVDPALKSFGLGADAPTYGIKKTKKEIEKCVVLCANCHRLHHAGLLEAECV